MSDYGWYIIDANREIHLGDEVGTSGPSDISAEFLEALRNNEGTLFMMFDDDDIWYYTGRLTGDWEGDEPLYDFGMPNAGCSYIKLWIDDAWVVV